MAATKVWGQANLTYGTSGSRTTVSSGPHGIAVDSEPETCMSSDTGNNRVVVFDDIRQAGTDPHSLVAIAGLRRRRQRSATPGRFESLPRRSRTLSIPPMKSGSAMPVARYASRVATIRSLPPGLSVSRRTR